MTDKMGCHTTCQWPGTYNQIIFLTNFVRGGSLAILDSDPGGGGSILTVQGLCFCFTLLPILLLIPFMILLYRSKFSNSEDVINLLIFEESFKLMIRL